MSGKADPQRHPVHHPHMTGLPQAQPWRCARPGVGLYARYALAGALCCALTHGAVVPLDVVKTRMQLEPGVYVKGLLATGLHLVREEGALAAPDTTAGPAMHLGMTLPRLTPSAACGGQPRPA